MDARDRLRLYLEQRRELGEYDLTLDELPVEDVLSIVGVKAGGGAAGAAPAASRRQATGARSAPVADVPAKAARPASPPAAGDSRQERSDVAAAVPPPAMPPAPPPSRVPTDGSPGGDWRKLLGAAAATPAESPAPSEEAPPPAIPTWLQALEMPMGIVVQAAPVPSAPHAGDGTDSLRLIADAVAACTSCALHSSAINSVPGEGNPLADFVCVGEAPGQTEDETGRPFVGAAGQLLTKILGAIDLSRDDVFICNVLKHRPPGNRNPSPEEVVACRPFLERQLALLKPRVILALGTFAAQTLLDTSDSLGKLRGRIHQYRGIPLVVTYHPAALLRNVAWKRPTWDDVQLARRIHDASLAANPA